MCSPAISSHTKAHCLRNLHIFPLFKTKPMTPPVDPGPNRSLLSQHPMIWNQPILILCPFSLPSSTWMPFPSFPDTMPKAHCRSCIFPWSPVLRAGRPSSPDLTEEVDARSAWRGDQRRHRVHCRIGVAVDRYMDILVWTRLCSIGDIGPHTE